MKCEPALPRLEGYLKTLDEDELDEVLKEVLQEIRSRHSERIKTDVLSHSQRLWINYLPN
jgi:hypothetical protein